MFRFTIFLVLASGFICFSASAVTFPPGETVRVAILRNVENISVDGGLGAIMLDTGNLLETVSLPLLIVHAKDGISLNGRILRKITLIPASSGIMTINGKNYRGKVDVLDFDKALLAVNELPLEEYLVGLINSEISSSWPIESIKAQAVIARTFALHRKNLRKTAPYHMENTVSDQVYEGAGGEDSRSLRGVMETAGEVLTYKGAIIQAFYHSTCGGSTESSENVWGAEFPYLKGVDCQYCRTPSSNVTWELSLSLQKLESLLKSSGIKVSGVTGVRAGEKNRRGRLKTVIISGSRGDMAVKGVDFRKAIGYGVLKSTNFTVSQENGEVLFRGMGNGHGVGLCQWGAKQRALDGFGYAEILSYYYPGAELKKLSEIR